MISPHHSHPTNGVRPSDSNNPIAEWTTPALTTVRQDFSAMGREAGKALVARIAKPAAPGTTVAVPVEFVVREPLARRWN